MPHRRHRRHDHAHPSPALGPSSLFLTPLALEPISARRHRRLPLGRRWVAAALGGATLALTIPIGLGPLPGGGTTIDPLAGGVAGAVSEPTPAASSPGSTPLPVPSDIPAPILSRLVPATDADGPRPVDRRIAPAIASLTGYRWPLQAGRISLPFKEIPGGEWTRDGKRLHDGVDMASFCGAAIGAAHDGVVLAAGRHFDDELGWLGDLRPYYALLNQRHAWNDLPIVVVIDDGNGYRSVYAHFRDVRVTVGERVHAGQLLGHEGRTGHASGCHLHYGLFSPFETKRFGLRADIRRHMRLPAWEIARIDPLQVLPRGDVALRTRQIAKAVAAAKRDAAAALAAAGS